MLLAIDTSTQYAGVAIIDKDGQLLHLVQWYSKHNHSVELLPTIEAMLSSQSIEIRSLTGIAVAIGPGRFSALRVGISVVKGLALSWGLPVVTASTLECEAYPFRSTGLNIAAILIAGRGELAWALFNESQGSFRQVAPEEVAPPTQFVPYLPSPSILCGEGLLDSNIAEATASTPNIRLATPYLPSLRVSALAHLGRTRLQAGMTQDAAAIQPLYLRRPTITEPRDSS